MRIEFQIPECFHFSLKTILFSAILAALFLMLGAPDDAAKVMTAVYVGLAIMAAVAAFNLVWVLLSLAWVSLAGLVSRWLSRAGLSFSSARKSGRRTVEYTDPFR
ncbi:MAG: hypothetical protein B7Y80_18945 [Hyphomicrobium sp. 32-62-53]|nr:MAG: hypothetical protein B7Z29_17635 [Hyphomicrobium sp. 12-62-95]OYX97691.1 MAG: hypothetical protein B7Y80_18945 [Hyphomicrobium sp. 32-62-53]